MLNIGKKMMIHANNENTGENKIVIFWNKLLLKIKISDKEIPFVFLFLLISAFGLLIPRLGFYWDDWPVIFLTKTQGISGFWDFYQYDRPFSAWTYMLSAPILGTTPIYWHIFSLLLRWLTTVFMWLTLRKIWPGKSRQTFWIGLLFSVYPLFDQQPVSVAYSQHWICYLFYFISLFLMILSQEQKRFQFHLILLSVTLSLVQMFTMEYFLGLELLRPLILLIYFHNRENILTKSGAIRKSLPLSLLYMTMVGIYMVWRIFFLELAGNNSNDPVVLKQLAITPVQTLIELLQVALQDMVYFLSSWFTALSPKNIVLLRPYFIASTGISLATAFLLWIALTSYKVTNPQNEQRNSWPKQALSFGIFAVLLGTLPVWIIGRQASIGLYGSRFGLAAMFGLSMMFVALLEWLSNRTQVKNTIICILIALAIHFHLYIARDFQDSWEKQLRVYWQLYWRAPDIDPGTAIISDGEIFRFVGLYSTSMGISLLYSPTDHFQDMQYWFFDMVYKGFYMKVDEMYSGMPLYDNLRNYSFEGNSKEALFLYIPDENQCLRILTSNDINDKDVPGLLQPLVPLSNLERIKSFPKEGWSPPETIFGKEPEPNWCYYFEKAELARQYQDWEEVLTIMNKAQEKGFSPSNIKEYLPWLDAYLHTDHINDAYKLTRQMKRLSDKIDDQICHLWLNATQVNQSEDLDSAYKNIKEELHCFD